MDILSLVVTANLHYCLLSIFTFFHKCSINIACLCINTTGNELSPKLQYARHQVADPVHSRRGFEIQNFEDGPPDLNADPTRTNSFVSELN